MDVKEIKELAKLMQETGLTSIEMVKESMTLRLERPGFIPDGAASIGIIGGADGPTAIYTAPDAAPAAAKEPEAKKEGTEVLSPTVGVFYAAPSPDSKPFVEIGDTVKKGDVLCIIEAMKLMNEITAEVSGTIAEVCVGNGQVVEYNQPLFRIV